jgi:hypothetical protein
MVKMNKQYFVVDDAIPKPLQDQVEKELNSDYFPWFKNKNGITVEGVVAEKYKDDKRIKENVMLGHTFHRYHSDGTKINSNWEGIPNKICEAILRKFGWKEISILRSKVNLLIQDLNLKDELTTPHVDISERMNNSAIILYYVNESDGKTSIFNDKNEIIEQITPKKGRLLFMKGDTLHSGQWPKSTPFRITLNINVDLPK